MKTVGQKIKALREKAGLSQEELGAMSHLGTAGIQRLEYGRGNPTINTLESVARALSVSLHQLGVGEVIRPRPPSPDFSAAAKVLSKLETLKSPHLQVILALLYMDKDAAEDLPDRIRSSVQALLKAL